MSRGQKGNSAQLAGAKRMAEQTTAVVEQEDVELIEAQKKAKEVNDARSGIGTRQMVGKTRGRATAVISYENFDDSLPDTLPKTFADFNTAAQKVGLGVSEPDLVELLILGANEKLYKAASDELAQFINPVWDKAVQNQFRLVVRNYAKGTGEELDDVARTIRQAFDKKHANG